MTFCHNLFITIFSLNLKGKRNICMDFAQQAEIKNVVKP